MYQRRILKEDGSRSRKSRPVQIDFTEACRTSSKPEVLLCSPSFLYIFLVILEHHSLLTRYHTPQYRCDKITRQARSIAMKPLFVRFRIRNQNALKSAVTGRREYIIEVWWLECVCKRVIIFKRVDKSALKGTSKCL